MKIKSLWLGGLLISWPAIAALSPTPADPGANPAHINDRAIFPNATIKGHPATLMLDTGSTDSALSSLEAVRLLLQYELPSPDSGPFGITEPAHIVIGQQSFTEPFAISPSGSEIDKIDGVIGWPAVRDNILVFDPDQRTISAVPELPPETAGWLKLKIRRSTLLTLETRLPNGSIGLIVVDTGADMGVGLPSSQWKSWRTTHPNAPSVGGHFIGVISSEGVGSGTMEQAWADALTIDELTLTDVPVNEVPDAEANALGNNLGKIVCTLGLEALARLDLVVDGKNGYAYLRPKSPNQGARGNDAITDAITGLDWTVANSVHLDEDSFLYSEAKFKIGKGDLDGAIADLDRVIAHRPDDDLAYAERGAVRGMKGDTDGAMEDLNRAIELNPSNALAHANRGADRLEKGDLNGATADYDKAIELNSEGDNVHYWCFFRQLGQMQLKQAPNDFSAIVATWNDSWTKTIGRYLAGSLDENAVLAAAEMPGDEPVVGQQCEAFYYVGMMRLLKGDTGGARDFFQKSLTTGEKSYDEYNFARAELARLDAAEKK